MCSTDKIEQYSAIKRNGVLIHATAWMDLKKHYAKKKHKTKLYASDRKQLPVSTYKIGVHSCECPKFENL